MEITKSNMDNSKLPMQEFEIRLFKYTVRAGKFFSTNEVRIRDDGKLPDDEAVGIFFGQCQLFKSGSVTGDSEQSLIIRLGGEFSSIDELVCERIEAFADKTHIHLNHIKGVSQDGSPLLINIYLLIPLNKSILTRKFFLVDMTILNKDFFTGKITKSKESVISKIELVF